MRDAQTLEIELGIEHEIFGEISLEKSVIFRFEHGECERIAAFLDGVNDSFEFGKHGLAKQGAAQIIDFAVDDVSPHLWVGSCLQQIVR
jgi:hypothetical protein